jgi:hypothetical protein
MRCSVCSNEVLPVVAVDIDGTLGDYYRLYTWFAARYLGRNLENTYDGIGEFSDHLGIDKETDREIKLALRQSGMKRDMLPYPGAAAFMQRLHGIGIEIWIATTRPWLRLDNIDPDTREWLRRFHIPYDYMIYGEDKYEDLTDRMDSQRVLYVVDDLLEQCEKAATALMNPDKVLQIARSHNRGALWERRGVFVDILDQITEAKEEWDAGDARHAAISQRTQDVERGFGR